VARLKIYDDGWVRLPATALEALASPDSLVLVVETGHIMPARPDDERQAIEPRPAMASQTPDAAAPAAPERAGAKPSASAIESHASAMASPIAPMTSAIACARSDQKPPPLEPPELVHL